MILHHPMLCTKGPINALKLSAAVKHSQEQKGIRWGQDQTIYEGWTCDISAGSKPIPNSLVKMSVVSIYTF